MSRFRLEIRNSACYSYDHLETAKSKFLFAHTNIAILLKLNMSAQDFCMLVHANIF